MIVFRYSIFDSLSVLLLNLGTLSFIEFKDGENHELFGEHVSGFKVFSYPESTEGLKVNYFVTFRGSRVSTAIGFRAGVLSDGLPSSK